MGRAWLHLVKVILSTYHQAVSYLTNVGQVDILSIHLAARQCYQLSMREQRGEKNAKNPPLEDQTPHSNHSSSEEKDPLVVDPLEKATLDGLEKFTYISSLLSNEEREQLRLMLLNNIYVLAWSHSYMIGINPTMAFHKLNTIPPVRPVR